MHWKMVSVLTSFAPVCTLRTVVNIDLKQTDCFILTLLSFASGSSELGFPAYQALAEPSGGYVLPHLSFTTPHLKRNLNFVLQQTYISRTEEAEGVQGIAAAECFVDLRVEE